MKADGKDEAAVAILLANVGKVAITTSNVRVLITAPAGTAFAPYSAPTDYGTDWTCRSDAPPAGVS